MEKLDELVAKTDVSKILIEYVLNSIEYILKSQLDLGLDMLNHCEEIVLSASKQSILIEFEVLSLISHTYSLYYYYQNDIQNSAISLFKSIQYFKQRKVPKKPLHKIFQNRILCSLHLQLFGLYSSVGNYDLAFIHLKESLKKSEEILTNCTIICSEHIHRHKNLINFVLDIQLNHPQYSLQDSPHYKLFHQLVLKSYPVLLYVQNKHSEPPRLETDWNPPVTLKDLFKMQPFDFSALSKSPELLEEFQEESLLYKVNIHACICYLLAETCKKMKCGYYKWIEAAFRFTKVLPKDWVICQVVGRISRGNRSVKHADVASGRKMSFSPDRYGVWKPSTPSGQNTPNKSSMDFSKRLKYRSKNCK